VCVSDCPIKKYALSYFSVFFAKSAVDEKQSQFEAKANVKMDKYYRRRRMETGGIEPPFPRCDRSGVADHLDSNIAQVYSIISN